MGRLFILYYDDIPDRDCVHCCLCGTRIAFIRHHFANISNDLWIFNEVFNVEVREDEHLVLGGNTLAETNCIKCRNLLGWKLVAVPQPRRTIREGIFYVVLGTLGPNNRDGGTNVQNADQNGVANEQDVGANEQNVDQNEGSNEQNVDQNEGANEQNVDQAQDEGANEHNDEHDGGANEQNSEQDGGTNEYLDL